MAYAVAEFFNIIGVSSVVPTTMSELIPYLLVVFIGVFLVSQCFRLLISFFHLIVDVAMRDKK